VVQLGDVVPIVRNTLVSKEVSTIQCLPFHQQLILCCMVKLAKDREVELSEILEKYRQVSRSEGLPEVGTPEFLSMCDLVATTELVTIKEKGTKQQFQQACLHTSTKSVKNMKVELRVSEEVVTFAVSEHGLLARMMG